MQEESGDDVVKVLMLLPNYLAAWLTVDGGYLFGQLKEREMGKEGTELP